MTTKVVEQYTKISGVKMAGVLVTREVTYIRNLSFQLKSQVQFMATQQQ